MQVVYRCAFAQSVFLYSIAFNASKNRKVSDQYCRNRKVSRVKSLKVLSFLIYQGIVLGFPLPTLVLTPGWAICFIRPKGAVYASL